MDDMTKASDPVGISLSRACYRERTGWFERFTAWRIRRHGIILTELLDEHLQMGDSRAAVVISVRPLRVAAYTDELDCVAMLRFPRHLVRTHRLKPGSRLLTVNTYTMEGRGARDLVPGPRTTHRYPDFFPLIAEFYSDDRDKIEARKLRIDEEEWDRCWQMGKEYYRRLPNLARDGSPLAASVEGYSMKEKPLWRSMLGLP